ncbi:MAG: hypothetical protein ABI175_17340 [Polyangiales bacterium]
MMRRLPVLALSAVVLATSPAFSRVARAEPSSTDAALAGALFTDGRTLMDTGKFAEACPKLAESHRLDPGGGVVLALALCREAEGKTASAWLAFEEAQVFARRDKRDDRRTTIEEHLDKLRPVLSRVSISLSEGARSQGVVVALDGRAISDASLGVAFIVDPGEHHVLATAPARAAFRETVTLGSSEEKRVVVPPLGLPRDDGDASGNPTRYSTARTVGWVSLSLGVVTLGVSGFFGLRAFSREHESEDHCPGDVCDTQGIGLHDQAKNAARVSTIAFAAGTVAVALGLVLVLTAPSSSGSASGGGSIPRPLTVKLAPAIGATSGLVLVGAF